MACADDMDMIACAALGRMYEQGLEGFAENDTRALQLFAQACSARNTDGCSGLAEMYVGGLGGLAKGERLAVQLFAQACEAGATLGCTSFGELYLGELGVLPDEEPIELAGHMHVDTRRNPNPTPPGGVLQITPRPGVDRAPPCCAPR